MVLRKLQLVSVADHNASLTPSGEEAFELLRLQDSRTTPTQEVNA